MIVSFALIPLLFAPQDALTRRGTELPRKLYDVASILRSRPEPADATRWGSHVLAASWAESDSETDEGGNGFWPARESLTPLQAEDMLSLIRSHVTPNAWSQGEASMDVQSGTLLVEAPAATHEEIVKFLPQLESLLQTQEISLRIDALNHPGASFPQGPILDAAETQKLALRLDQESLSFWGAQGKVFSGSTFAASRRERSAFLQSYSVEVATKSKGTRPVIAQSLSGPAATIRPYLLSGSSRVHMNFTLENCGLRGLEKFETRAQDAGSVQIPRISLALFSGSASLAPGESLLLRASGEIEAAFWIRAEWKSRPQEAPGIAIFDPRVFLDAAGRTLPSLDEKLARRAQDFLESGREPFSADFLLQALPLRGGTSERSGWQRVSGGFFLRRGPGANMTDAVKSLELAHANPVLFDLTLSKDPAGGQPLFQTTLAASPGQMAGFLGGIESSHVAGYDIQIAQESTIAQPIVVPLFSGLQCRIRVLSRRESGTEIAIEWDSHAVLAGETVRSGLSSSGDFVAASTRTAECQRMLDLPWTSQVSLGELGPISDATRGERVFASVRARSSGK